jgi:CRISPR type III-A-associated RAMP protein Csm4
MGRDISSGSGQFKLEFGKAELIQEPKNGECFTTLSLYCPKDDEIKLLNKSEKMFYELLRREGKSRDGIMKKEILMFNHGSTFPSMDKKFLGKVELVREIPPVIEWGYAYPMKVSKYEM